MRAPKRALTTIAENTPGIVPNQLDRDLLAAKLCTSWHWFTTNTRGTKAKQRKKTVNVVGILFLVSHTTSRVMLRQNKLSILPIIKITHLSLSPTDPKCCRMVHKWCIRVHRDGTTEYLRFYFSLAISDSDPATRVPRSSSFCTARFKTKPDITVRSADYQTLQLGSQSPSHLAVSFRHSHYVQCSYDITMYTTLKDYRSTRIPHISSYTNSVNDTGKNKISHLIDSRMVVFLQLDLEVFRHEYRCEWRQCAFLLHGKHRAALICNDTDARKTEFKTRRTTEKKKKEKETVRTDRCHHPAI